MVAEAKLRRRKSGGSKRSTLAAEVKVPEHPYPHRPPEEWVSAALAAHNRRRIKHWAPPLVWSDDCYNNAKKQVEEYQLEGKRIFLEGPVGTQGQCHMGPCDPLLDWSKESAERCLQQWYNAQMGMYNFKRGLPREEASDFTQVVWMGTTSVGMAISQDGRYCVANYYPAGNAGIWKFSGYVGALQDSPPPWRLLEPTTTPDQSLAPCRAEAWERHDRVTAALAAAAGRRERRPMDPALKALLETA